MIDKEFLPASDEADKEVDDYLSIIPQKTRKLTSNNLEVNFKKFHKDAVTPFYARPGDACLDLTAVSREYDLYKELFIYDTGIGLELPEGYVGLLFPRSSSSEKPLIVANSIGVIDSGYRGSIKIKYKPHGSSWLQNNTKIYEVGDKVAQLLILPYPRISLNEVSELSPSERGDNGWGSTDESKS